MTHADAHPSKPLSSRQDAFEVVRRLREAGYTAYFAGGCVRDALLGLEATDFDVATDAQPAAVRGVFRATQAVGAAFGVILVHQGQSVVEVATFRSDAAYEDGRRPSAVHFTTPQHDAQRRDFTINGLFLDPLENRVIDYVGGQQDLADRRLRAIGDPAARFREDHLRLLRAVRFAARFDLQVDPDTAAAIRHDAPLLRRISPERIADELRRMLTVPTRPRAWQLLWDFALVDTLFRFLPGAEPCELDPQRCPFLLLSGETVSFPLALAAAALSYRLQGVGHPPLKALLVRQRVGEVLRATRQALRLSNEESSQIEEILQSCDAVLQDAPRLATLKRFLARPTSPDSQRLLRALAAAGWEAGAIVLLEPRLAALAGVEVAPPPLLTGDDLVAAGLSPGPLFKRILMQVYDEQLEDRLPDRAAALELGLQLAQSAK